MEPADVQTARHGHDHAIDCYQGEVVPGADRTTYVMRDYEASERRTTITVRRIADDAIIGTLSQVRLPA
jgi:hypothetical protein